MFLDVCFRLSIKGLHITNVQWPVQVNRGVIQIVMVLGNIVRHVQVKVET